MAKKLENIFIIIPVYNEAQKLNEVINEVRRYAKKIVVVDDGSVDGTAKLKSKGKLIVLRHPINLGQGAAFQTGFEYAKIHKADAIVTFDGDGQFLASEIPKLLRPIISGRFDISLGSRFLGQTINMPFKKWIILKMGIIFTYLFSGIKLTDTHNGFRALNKKALEKINITQNRMAHSSEIPHLVKRNGLRCIEVPVTVLYNDYTKGKGQKISNFFWILIDLIFKKI